MAGYALDGAAPGRNLRAAIDGSQASLSTPSTDSISERASLVWLTALTVWVITGMPASLPSPSVLERNLSRAGTLPCLNLSALARNIRCGKSRFHGCGGVYGHFVM